MIPTLALALLLTGTDPAALHAAASSTCASFPLRSTGTVHYFCDCQAGAEPGCAGHAGDDARASSTSAADCTDPSAPCRTFTQANVTFNRMPGGDTIAFCRGGAFDQSGTTTWYNPRCAPAADMRAAANATTCDVRDYAPTWGGAARPIIRQTATLAHLFKFAGGWTHGLRVLNLDLEGGGPGCNGTGSGCGPADVGFAAFEVENGASNALVCNNAINGWCVAAINQADMRPQSADWDYYGNTFAHEDLDVFLGAGPNITIDANVMEDSGSCDGQKHVIYPAGSNTAGQIEATNLRVVNNDVRFVDATCSGPMFSGHGTWNGVLFENNRLRAAGHSTPGCYGIGLVPDVGYPLVVQYGRNLVIRRNRIESAGWNLIYCASCPGVIVEDNVLVSSGASTWSSAIDIPIQSARTIQPDPITTGAIIRNNTIYSAADNPPIYAISAPDPYTSEGSGFVIANNAVSFGASGTCFHTHLAAGAYAFVGNNACFQGTWGTTYDATTHLTADPAFASPPADLSLRPGSPLAGAGSADHAPATDFLGDARPSPPSIGAFDVGGGGSTSGGGTGSAGRGTGGGCNTSTALPGALAALALLALAPRRRRSR